MTDKYGLTEASNQIADAFDTYHAANLAEAFLKGGDITPEGWKKFATANKLTPKMSGYLMEMVDGYNQMVGSKNRVQHASDRATREQGEYDQAKALNELTGQKKQFEVDNMSEDRERAYKLGQDKLSAQKEYWGNMSDAAMERALKAGGKKGMGLPEKFDLENLKSMLKTREKILIEMTRGTDNLGQEYSKERKDQFNEAYRSLNRDIAAIMNPPAATMPDPVPRNYLTGDAAQKKANQHIVSNTYNDDSVMADLSTNQPEVYRLLQEHKAKQVPSLEKLKRDKLVKERDELQEGIYTLPTRVRVDKFKPDVEELEKGRKARLKEITEEIIKLEPFPLRRNKNGK